MLLEIHTTKGFICLFVCLFLFCCCCCCCRFTLFYFSSGFVLFCLFVCLFVFGLFNHFSVRFETVSFFRLFLLMELWIKEQFSLKKKSGSPVFQVSQKLPIRPYKQSFAFLHYVLLLMNRKYFVCKSLFLIYILSL